MKDVKFRFWCTRDKSMYPPMSLEEFNKKVEYSSNLIPLQYTGKKDCMGNEIYDGDIIEFDKDEWGGKDNIHVVSWDEDDASWSWGGGCTSDMDWRTVIGNVHEHPHLRNK